MSVFKCCSDDQSMKTADKTIGNCTTDNKNTQKLPEEIKMEGAQHFRGILNANKKSTLTAVC